MERRPVDREWHRTFSCCVLVLAVLVLDSARAPAQAVAGRDDQLAPAEPQTTAPADRATESEGLCTRLPANLIVPEPLRPIVEEVLRRSPTFRRQVTELRRAPRVRMTVSFGNLSSWHTLRAESTVYRYQWGAMRVDTRLYTVRDIADVIAHELEHVCEQIEGVDVRALAHHHHSGVYNRGGHYETQRAVYAGRQVAREALGISADALLTRRTN
jgi:hypothetical protein